MGIFLCAIVSVLNPRITLASEGDESDEENHLITVDFSNTANEENGHSSAIRSQVRTDLFFRFSMDFQQLSPLYKFYELGDRTKNRTCGCKVQRGIFYYKLQSDNDEDPLGL